MKAKEVTAAIRAKVGATRKPRTVKAPDPAAAMTKVVKSIKALPVEAQRQLLHALPRRFQPSPAAVPTVPVEAQRQPVAPPHVAGRIDQAQPTAAPHTPQHVSRIDAPAPAQRAPSIDQRRKRKQASSDHGAARPVDADRRPDASLG